MATEKTDSDSVYEDPYALYDRPWEEDPAWSSYSSQEREEVLKGNIMRFEMVKAFSESALSFPEQDKANLLQRLSQSDPTKEELLRRVEEAERDIKDCEGEVKRWQELISANQQQLGHEHEAHMRSQEILENALKNGYVDHELFKVIIAGFAGSGKSSLKALMLGEPPPAVRHSTPCAERPVRARSVSHMKIKSEGGDWIKVNQEKLLELVGNTLPQLRELLDRLTKPAPAKPVPASSSPLQPVPPNPLRVAKAIEPQSTPQATPSLSAADRATEVIFQKLADTITRQRASEGSDLKVDSLLSSKLIHFIDSGGQPQFLELFRIFLHKATTSICVMRLSERLDERPQVEYYQHGTPIVEPHSASNTNEEIVKCLMRSLQSQLTVDDNGAIAIVGTHLDKEHECSERLHEKDLRLFELLRPLVDSLELYDSGSKRVIFPVNTKEPGKHEQEVAAHLRELIEKRAPKAIKLPIWWYVLELVLQQLSYLLERGVLSYKECLSIAQKLNFDEEAFQEALKYLHELNLFLYYPKILPNVVFSNPQVPLDKLTELVERSFELRSGTKASGDWLKFSEQGIVQEKFLHDQHFSKHYAEGLFSPSDLLKLFQELLILAPLSSTEYLMPSLLETLPPARLEEHRAMKSEVSPLLIHFPHGWPRSGVFCCLIVYLINRCKWKLSLQSGRKPLLVTRNCIKFRVPSSPPCTVALIDSYAYYEVHVHVSEPLSVCQGLYPSIRQTLLDGVGAAARNLHYNNSTPYVAFFCPHRHLNEAGMLCTAQLTEDLAYLECTAIEEHIKKTTEQHSTWFKEKVIVSAKRVSSCLAGKSLQSDSGTDTFHQLQQLLEPANAEQDGGVNKEQQLHGQAGGVNRKRLRGPESEEVDTEVDTELKKKCAVSAGNMKQTSILGRHISPGTTPLVAAVTPDDIAELMEVLVELAGSWELFIQQLGVSAGVVEQIKLENAQKPDFPKLCLQSGLRLWVLSNDQPTYQQICSVLLGNTITNVPLARRVEQLATAKLQGL